MTVDNTNDGGTVVAAEYFDLRNPEGEGRSDVPSLLRRVADEVAHLGSVFVVSIIVRHDFDSNGDFNPTATVVYDRVPSE